MNKKFKWIMVVCFVFLGVTWIALQQKNINDSADQAKKDIAAKELSNYLSCTYEQAVCIKLFPNAAKRVVQAKKASDEQDSK